jgi:hypothetical protein
LGKFRTAGNSTTIPSRTTTTQGFVAAYGRQAGRIDESKWVAANVAIEMHAIYVGQLLAGSPPARRD